MSRGPGGLVASEPASSVSTEGSLRRFRLVPTLLVAALAVGLFDWFSAGGSLGETARRGIVSHRPPVYGRYEPSFTRYGIIALVLAAAWALGSFLLARSERSSARIAVPLAVGFLVVFGATVANVNGDPRPLTDPLVRTRPPDYQPDVHLVRETGIREFNERFPDLVPRLTSVHSRSHPPGPLVALSVLQSMFATSVVARAVTLAVASALMAVPTWFIARRFTSERGALFAVLFLACAPGPVIFTFLSLDTVYATMIATAAALLTWGVTRNGRPWLAWAGGFAVGITTYFTYAVAFAAVFGVVLALASQSLRRAIRALLYAAAGGVVAILLLKVALGYDLFASYSASREGLGGVSLRSYRYWIFGNWMAWLTLAGLPIAALALREAIVERPAYLWGFLISLVVFWALPVGVTKLAPGETERTWSFLYPVAAAAAGAALARWEAGCVKRRSGVVAILVGFAALQTILLEALYFTYW